MQMRRSESRQAQRPVQLELFGGAVRPKETKRRPSYGTARPESFFRGKFKVPRAEKTKRVGLGIADLLARCPPYRETAYE